MGLGGGAVRLEGRRLHLDGRGTWTGTALGENCAGQELRLGENCAGPELPWTGTEPGRELGLGGNYAWAPQTGAGSEHPVRLVG